MENLKLSLLPAQLSVCRLRPDAPLPDWVGAGCFSSITRTLDELSIVCETERIPQGVAAVSGWRALKVEGPLDFALVGILAGIAGVLAEAKVSLFAVSTYDTDYILVNEGDLPRAVEALRAREYIVL